MCCTMHFTWYFNNGFIWLFQIYTCANRAICSMLPRWENPIHSIILESSNVFSSAKLQYTLHWLDFRTLFNLVFKALNCSNLIAKQLSKSTIDATESDLDWLVNTTLSRKAGQRSPPQHHEYLRQLLEAYLYQGGWYLAVQCTFALCTPTFRTNNCTNTTYYLYLVIRTTCSFSTTLFQCISVRMSVKTCYLRKRNIWRCVHCTF